MGEALRIVDDPLTEVSARKVEELPEFCKTTWVTSTQHQRAVAHALVRMQEDHHHPEARNLAEWVHNNLGLDPSSTSRLLYAARGEQSADPQRRRALQGLSIWQSYHAQKLAEVGEPLEQAVALAKSRESRGRLKQRVRERQPDQHHDTSPLRTFSVLVTADDLHEIRQAMNLSRHELGEPYPADGAALRAIAADFLSGFLPSRKVSREARAERLEALLNVARAAATANAAMRAPDDLAEAMEQLEGTGWSPTFADPFAGLEEPSDPPLLTDILAGRCRCIDCGIWWPVQRHHAPPRGHKIRRRVQNGSGQWHDTNELWNPEDPDWPTVYICANEHRAITENWDGTWREHLERWLADPKHGELREKVRAFLGDRELGQI